MSTYPSRARRSSWIFCPARSVYCRSGSARSGGARRRRNFRSTGCGRTRFTSISVFGTPCAGASARRPDISIAGSSRSRASSAASSRCPRTFITARMSSGTSTTARVVRCAQAALRPARKIPKPIRKVRAEIVNPRRRRNHFGRGLARSRPGRIQPAGAALADAASERTGDVAHFLLERRVLDPALHG